MNKDVIHRGNFLKKSFKKNRVKVIDIADAMNVGRTTIYNYFEDKDLNIVKLASIFSFIGGDYNEVRKLAKSKLELQNLENYIINNPKEVISEEEEVKIIEKYYSLLEKYSSIQEELSLVKDKLIACKNGTKSALKKTRTA